MRVRYWPRQLRVRIQVQEGCRYFRPATPSSSFQAGDLNFHSDAYDWLVVNQGGIRAQYKGTGTINGALAPTGDAYRFMLWATDDDPDKFRIKIWYEDAGDVVVYDNGFAGSGFETGQPIDGGSIIIHTKKK